jgi:hypothetical protein
MKKTSDTRPKKPTAQRVAAGRAKSVSAADDLRPHYDLDYQKSRPNRFASQFSDGAVAVVLDPDVATVFRSSEAVNSFLRSAISAMSEVETSRKKRVG